MNSFSAGCAKRSSHRDGFTPVSHLSNAMSFASCHLGENKCTSFAISSKQNRKNKCGYQCRQKCKNFCATVGQTFLSGPLCFPLFQALHPAARVSTRHKTKMTAATNACAPINFTGCAKFSSTAAIKTQENASYPSAIHSNAPQAAHAPDNSSVISATIPCRSVSSLTARSALLSAPTFASQAINAPFPSQSCRCTSLIEGSPCSPVSFSSLFVFHEIKTQRQAITLGSCFFSAISLCPLRLC